MLSAIDEFLSSFGRFGIHLGLERIEQLLKDLDSPQDQVPVIHVAGTNGKGSVCAYLSSILQAAGYRVGRYISPHLIDWRERICINQNWISSADLLTSLQHVKQVIQADNMPTQFEVITAAAWWYFAQQQVDVAVIETGLGGRLDATNVCDRPLVSVITSISMEHWQRLGNTLGAIAFEKAGIIKPQCPAVIGPMPAEAVAVMEAKVRESQSPVTWVEPAEATATGAKWQSLEYPLPLLGKHQLVNSAIAIATIRFLQEQGWQISDADIIKGMSDARWTGRLQWVNYSLGEQTHRLLIDGAHNVAAAEYLRKFVDEFYPHCRKRWVIGMLDTKDHTGILKALLHPEDLLFAVPVPEHQSADPTELTAISKTLLHTTPYSYDCLSAGLAAAFSQDWQPTDLVILCGSLYLVGSFLKDYDTQSYEYGNTANA